MVNRPIIRSERFCRQSSSVGFGSVLAFFLILTFSCSVFSFYSESLSISCIAFSPLGRFLETFFSRTSYLSRVKSQSHVPGQTKLTVLWMTLALFLGLWGSLDPLKARKSSSFSLFDRAIANFGQMDPSLPDEEPFLSSGRVCGTPLLLLPLPGSSLSGEATVWMPLFCCCCAGDFMVANSSEFLQIQKQHID